LTFNAPVARNWPPRLPSSTRPGDVTLVGVLGDVSGARYPSKVSLKLVAVVWIARRDLAFGEGAVEYAVQRSDPAGDLSE